MDDLLAAIDDALSTTTASQAAINRISKIRDKLVKAIEIAKQELTDTKDKVVADRAFKLSLDEALKESSNIFQKSVNEATSKSIEYNYPEFKWALLNISDMVGLFKYTVHGTGWSKNISLSIDMDGTAGTIADYALSVSLARGYLGVGQGKNAERASLIWRTKVYPNESLYKKTIKARKSYFAATAPFWSLLNYGNKAVSMASDRGGTAYPTSGPTRFVEKARDAVYKLFRTKFLERRALNKELRAELKAAIVVKEAKLVNLNDLL